mgnify:FL=1
MSILERARELFYDFKDWHEDTTEAWIDRLNLSMYGAMWLAFTKGVLVVLLLQWIF